MNTDHRIDRGGVNLLAERADTTYPPGFLNRKDAKNAKRSSQIRRALPKITAEQPAI